MDPILIQFLLGLYFVGTSVPTLLDNRPEGSPMPRAAFILFIEGLVLWALAFLHIALIR